MKWPKISLWRSTQDYQWYWNVKATNGEIIASSEGYHTRQAAMKGIRSLRINAPIAKVVRKPDADRFLFI